MKQGIWRDIGLCCNRRLQMLIATVTARSMTSIMSITLPTLIAPLTTATATSTKGIA